MITQISPAQADEALATGVRLIDVRMEWEWDLVHIDGSELLDQPTLDALTELPRDTPLMFLCHHGVRSYQACAWFVNLGFSDVRNVAGGIEAWATQHDPSLARY